jgi:hypothetical protein
MSSLDDKSGYDHILLDEDSRTYFGLQFGGFYFVFNTIPFGFKASAYMVLLLVDTVAPWGCLAYSI